MALTEYNRKRDFKQTSEPKGFIDRADQFRFVVQRHQARRLHFDFRLELNGVLLSWAVPKGPSMSSTEKRFAVRTEDHPVAYLKFKGDIPEGNYGGGHMDIWDQGKYIPVDQELNPLTTRQANQWLKKGELKIFLKGKIIQGGFVLIRLKETDNWLLIKHRDEFDIKKPYDIEKAKQKKVTAKKAVTKKRYHASK